MERETTCCFTGHRPEKLPWGTDESDPRCRALKRKLAAAVLEAYDRGMRHFICGMARGCDLYFCEAALALREVRPGVTVEAAIPCESQPDRWPEGERRRYRRLVDQCDFETMVQHHYDRWCMQRRNRYMVDRSSMIVAAFDGSPGGTMQTLAYALKKGLDTLVVDIEPSTGADERGEI